MDDSTISRRVLSRATGEPRRSRANSRKKLEHVIVRRRLWDDRKAKERRTGERETKDRPFISIFMGDDVEARRRFREL